MTNGLWLASFIHNRSLPVFFYRGQKIPSIVCGAGSCAEMVSFVKFFAYTAIFPAFGIISVAGQGLQIVVQFGILVNMLFSLLY
jgi:hypothetical protein